MSTETNEKLVELKQQKTDISAKIKELEETPLATNKSIWFILMKILAPISAGVFIANYKAGIVAACVFVLVILIGILDRVFAQNKNKKRNQKIIELKAEETRLVSLITAENAKNR